MAVDLTDCDVDDLFSRFIAGEFSNPPSMTPTQKIAPIVDKARKKIVLTHDDRKTLLAHVLSDAPKDIQERERLASLSPDDQFDEILWRHLFHGETNFYTLLNVMPVENKLAERNIGAPERAEISRRKTPAASKDAPPSSTQSTSVGVESPMPPSQLGGTNRPIVDPRDATDDDDIDIGTLLLCAESSRMFGSQFNQPNEPNWARFEGRQGKGGKVQAKGCAPPPEELRISAILASKRAQQVMGQPLERITVTDTMRGAVTDTGRPSEEFANQRLLEQVDHARNNMGIEIEDVTRMEYCQPLPREQPLPQSQSPPSLVTGEAGRASSDDRPAEDPMDSGGTSDSIECPQEVIDLYLHSHPFGFIDRLPKNAEVVYDKGMLGLQTRPTTVDQYGKTVIVPSTPNPPLSSMPAFNRKNTSNTPLSFLELIKRNAAHILNHYMIDRFMREPSYTFPSSKFEDIYRMQAAHVRELNRAQIHSACREPISNGVEKPCIADLGCIGVMCGIGRLIAFDFSLLGEHNNNRHPAIPPTGLCILCIAKQTMLVVTQLHASNTNIPQDLSICPFMCKVNKPGEYRIEDVYMPPTNRYIGLIGPMISPSINRYEVDTRIVHGITVRGLTDRAPVCSHDRQVVF